MNTTRNARNERKEKKIKREKILDMPATGKEIKKYMDMKNISADKLSQTLKVSKQAIYKYIKGESLPNLHRLFLMARIFGVSVDDILIIRKGYRFPHQTKIRQDQGLQK